MPTTAVGLCAVVPTGNVNAPVPVDTSVSPVTPVEPFMYVVMFFPYAVNVPDVVKVCTQVVKPKLLVYEVTVPPVPV
jgi:hypothetical protein